MNKIFTLLLTAAATLSATAADFTLMFGDTPVTKGETYETGYTIDEEASDDVLVSYKQNSNLYIKAPKGTNITIEVNGDNGIEVCTFGGCSIVMPNRPVSKNGIIGQNSSAADGEMIVESCDVYKLTELAASENPRESLSALTANVTIYETGNPFNSQSCYVVMHNVPQSEIGGVGNVEIDNDAVIVTEPNVMHYSVARAGKLEIFNVKGARVMSRTITGKGALNLNTLPKGVYLFQINSLKGKFIVK